MGKEKTSLVVGITAPVKSVELVKLAKASGSFCGFIREYYKKVEGMDSKKAAKAVSAILVEYGKSNDVEDLIISRVRSELAHGKLLDGIKTTSRSTRIVFRKPTEKVASEIVAAKSIEKDEVIAARDAEIEELKKALAAKPVVIEANKPD